MKPSDGLETVDPLLVERPPVTPSGRTPCGYCRREPAAAGHCRAGCAPNRWRPAVVCAWLDNRTYGQLVSSYAIDDGGLLLLFDPIALPSEIVELAAGRETAIVLTCPWHERDARSLVERFSWPLFAPPPDSQEDLMRKYGVTAEEAAGGSPDLAWLLAGDTGGAHLYAAGDRLPVGVEAFPGWEHNDVVLWIENRRAVVVGDALVDFGQGLEISPSEWSTKLMTPEQIAERLRPLLALPVEQVLATHGGPTDRAALDRALA